MYLVIAIVAVILGSSMSVSGIWDIPIGQLTLHMLFDNLIALVYYGCGIVLGIKSFEVDRIWPWHWTRSFVYSVLARGAVAFALVYGLFMFTVERQMGLGLDLIALVLAASFLLYFVLFSAQFEFFERKKVPVEKLAEEVVLAEPWYPTENHHVGTRPGRN